MSNLIATFGKLYTIHRYNAPGDDNGQAQQPVEVLVDGQPPYTMVASIQPLKPFEMNLLPEGMRNRSMVKVYTYAELQVTDESAMPPTIADRFTWSGRNYEVLSLMDWEGTNLSHRKYLAAKVENA